MGISFVSNGWMTYLPLIVFFGIVPLLEFIFKPDKSNFEKDIALIEKDKLIYSFILYLAIPVQMGMLIFFLYAIQEPLTNFELLAFSNLPDRFDGLFYLGIVRISLAPRSPRKAL